MEAFIYPAVKIFLIAIAIMAAIAYFAHKAGNAKLFKQMIKGILNAALSIMAMFAIAKAGNHLTTTINEAFKDFGKKHISSSSQGK